MGLALVRIDCHTLLLLSVERLVSLESQTKLPNCVPYQLYNGSLDFAFSFAAFPSITLINIGRHTCILI